MAAPADRSREIAFHTDLVRRSCAVGDIATARGAYAALVESWKQHNALHGGAFEAQVDAVKRDYSEFVKSDPVYHAIRQALVQAIRRQPGILQTEMYTVLSKVPKEDLQYALYFAADHGFIVRTKKGRTYALSLPDGKST
jgi:hypothetical protein